MDELGDRLGVVMSGGGARGAYVAGVLSYAFGELARDHRRAPPVSIICGTSVGAIHSAFLASVVDDPAASMHNLIDVWSTLQLSDVFSFGLRQFTALPRVLMGGSEAAGIFDAKPLASLVTRAIPWRGLARNLRDGHLEALTIAATQVSTGRAMVYVDRAPGVPLPTGLGRKAIVSGEHVFPKHVLASASMPIFFPPVRIGGDLYFDGGLRMNTPTAPAIHLGATKLFVISLASPDQMHGTGSGLKPGTIPGASYLLGKVFNAFQLDQVAADIAEVERLNHVLRDGLTLYGEDFIDKMNMRAAERGAVSRRLIRTLSIQPSVDIGKFTGDHLRTNRERFGRLLGKRVMRLLDIGEGADADLASYVLFDGMYARELIELGRTDAARKRDQLLEFLYESRN